MHEKIRLEDANELTNMRLGWFLILQCCLGVLAALNCYMCPRTDGQTVEEANIECLALGWEISCSSDQDRCYSRTYFESTEVEKGCGKSEECVGSTSCCEDSYCNADPQSAKSGQGNPCGDSDDCIQGGTTMICDRDNPNDSTKRCLCTADSYRRGATCKQKSFPDEACSEDHECFDVNTTCIRRHCMCSEGLFANGTTCSQQKQLGQACLLYNECAGKNTMCVEMRCACAFGFLVVNGTNSCSDATYIKFSFSPVVLPATLSMLFLLQGR